MLLPKMCCTDKFLSARLNNEQFGVTVFPKQSEDMHAGLTGGSLLLHGVLYDVRVL